MPNFAKKTRWGVAAVCLAAFVTIAILADQIFEHVPHSEDEVAYVFQAKVFAQGRLSAPTPPNSDAFWTPFVVDYNGRRFGKYPPGWPALLSLGIRLQAPWLINALLGTLTLGLIAGLGARWYRPGTGLWAAGLGLLTPGFLFLSSSLLSHPASLFWATLALVTLSQLIKDQNRALASRFTRRAPYFAFATGLALGATFMTRPFAAVGIGAGVGVFVLVLVIRRELSWTVLPWLVGGSIISGALLPLYWWAVTGNPTFNAYVLVWPYDRVGFGPEIGPHGYDLLDAIVINTPLKLEALATGLFGWPGWSNLIFLPIPFLARRTNRWDWLLLSTLAGMIVVHNFYWAFGGVDGGFPRYYYDALPALLLLTARGIQIAAELLARWRPRLGWLPVGLVMGLVAYNVIWNLPAQLSAQKGKYDITPTQLQAVEQANLSEPALVIVKNVASWTDFAAPFVANSPTLDGNVVYAIDWGPAFTQKLRAQFEERTCWELIDERLQPCP
jgi:4-amino-4-deoxy-L-arabinose transferase-like glycosyltransferase